MRKSDETRLCIAFTKHCETYFPRRTGILDWTHIPLEGRSAKDGAKLKKMGVRAGWFDYVFIAKNAICFLEAKVENRDYNENQKRFIANTLLPMGIPFGKFQTVQEGHHLLISLGINPISKCLAFKEPNLLTWEDKLELVNNFYRGE